MPKTPFDMLKAIFDIQEELDESITSKHVLSVPNGRNDKIKMLGFAMNQEVSELIDSTNWKWWRSGVDMYDEENIRVELVDILHFLVSAFLAMGMTAEDAYRAYLDKVKINYQRQKDGYGGKRTEM